MHKSKKTNVLVFDSCFEEGGAEKITHEILQKICKEKYDFTICTLYDPGRWGDQFINDGYKFYGNLIRNRYDPSALWKLSSIIERNKINLIYFISQPLTLFWAVSLGKLKRIPTIAVIHNMFSVKGWIKQNIQKIFLPRVDKIVAVGKLQKEQLVRNEMIPQDLITVIYNGIDVKKYGTQDCADSQYKDFVISPKSGGISKTVGIVCRLVELKGVDVFLKAASLVLKKNSAVQFVVVGDGPEMLIQQRLAQSLGIDRKVSFLGYRNDIEKLLPLFDVCVLSSRTEAFPMVILEYMAAGKPVVATKVGCVHEMLIDRHSGFLVKSGDAESLADRVSMLLYNENLAHSMGSMGRKLVSERFSIEFTAKQTETLINKLLS